ncbi:MAG: sugar transferase [Oscillospiraceae bacterium]|nr:sugar transferase [Oscillospiraceae bacterium]
MTEYKYSSYVGVVDITPLKIGANAVDNGTISSERTFEKIECKQRRAYFFTKRVIDVIFSLVALVCLSPFFLVLSILIFLDDPHGSPFFVQTRVGKDGKEFRFYKFRSMVVNAEDLLPELLAKNERDGRTFKMKDDPRITRVGRFIRRTSIDELPQFLNVLKGDMSVVGPRPPLPREVETYSEYEMQRLLIKPGLTCYWQTLKHRHQLSFEEWVDLDLQYIETCSLWVDLKLVFKTFAVIFEGRNC